MGVPLAALAINQQQPGPIDQASKALQLKALAQQQQYQAQAQPLELQQRQQQVQQGQLQLADQQAMTKALQAWDGKDVEELPGMVLKHGGSAQAVFGLKNQIVEQRKNLASADEATLKNQSTRNDLLAGHIESIKSATDKPAAYQKMVNEVTQQGIAKPGQLPQQYPGDDQLDLFEKSLIGQKQLVAQEQKDREVKAQELTAAARKTSAETSATHLQAEMPGGPLNRVTQDIAVATNPQIQKGKIQVAAAESAARAAATQAQQAKGAPEVALDPKQQATAQAIVDGRMSPPGSFALKTPYWQNIMGEVFKQDPQWNEQRAQLRKSYTIGKQSGEINAINTALGHVGNLNDAIDALKNGNVQVLNRIANNLGAQTGATPQTTFNTILHRVGPEITKAYLGSGGGQGERGTTEKDFDTALSPDQLKSNTGITAKLLRSKISSLENQWNQNAPQGQDFQTRFITPSAKQTLDKLDPQGGGGGAGMIRARDPQGKLHEAKAGTPLPAGWKAE